MNKRAIKTLEFDKIVQLVSDKAISKLGKEEALLIEPIFDINEIKKMQQETSEAVSCILKKSSLPLGGITDITNSIKRVNAGGMLSIAELLHMHDFLYVCNKTKKYAIKVGKEDDYYLLDSYFEMIELIPKLQADIGRCIINENEVADNASDELSSIRRTIKSTNQKIKDQLNGIIQSQTYKTMLQDPVITIRNDRYCVPVKQEYRNVFQGMVHDQSATGATVFIEPMAVVQSNNKLRELQISEKKEIEKILMRLSQQVNEYSDIIKANFDVITKLDVIFAKGEYSISINATEPIFNERGYLNIKSARHPLIDADVVVATDIYLGDTFSTLLITGPNTGGKTVTLKNIGLFSIMGQSGLHIPAKSGSELTVFDNVFADIGDEQSIEQSLSTFSSHMTNIVSILDEVTDKSLVLLDELGAGTDPVEGAALAISILQYLYDRGAKVAVTTHYSELKAYALSTSGVENASCEFDVVSLKPTYKLLIGIPGKSNAFSISKRLGLADFIIDDAKKYVSSKDEKFEDIITDLEISKKNVINEQERAETFRREAERLKKDIQEEKEKLQQEKDKIILEAKQEARRIATSAKQEADRLIKEMNEKQKNSSTIKEIDKIRQDIQNNVSSYETDIAGIGENTKVTDKQKAIKKGDRVQIVSMNQIGVVTSDQDKNGDVTVTAGAMKIKVNVKKLQYLNSEKTNQPTVDKKYKSAKTNKSQTMRSELDLRGLMVQEALEEVDKYIDDATMSSLHQVTIIHGKGTGALRNAVHQHLKYHPQVKSYRLGNFGEGDMGVTVVELL